MPSEIKDLINKKYIKKLKKFIMIVDSLKKLKKSLNSNNLSIYLFHGVIKKKIKKNSVRNYNSKHIDIIKFEKYIKFLSTNGKLLH